MNELERIVKQLENGDLPLEQSLQLFETGIGLARQCRERLDNAEKRIEILVRQADGSIGVEELE